MKSLFILLTCLSLSTIIAQEPPRLEKPNEHHKHLRKMTGTWDFKSKFHLLSGQIIEMTGVEIAKMQPGGFWLISDYTGKYMGMPFHAHALIGYEAHKKKYSGTWTDSFDSVLVILSGTCSKDGKTITMVGKGYAPVQKREITYKHIYETKDTNTKIYKLYYVEAEKEELIMEFASKRRPPKLNLNSTNKDSFTHEITGPFGSAYYLDGPQQARPPEGKFKSGTRVRLIRNAGSYSVVQSETGITAHVSTAALKTINKK